MGKKPVAGAIGVVWIGLALAGCDCCRNKGKTTYPPPQGGEAGWQGSPRSMGLGGGQTAGMSGQPAGSGQLTGSGGRVTYPGSDMTGGMSGGAPLSGRDPYGMGGGAPISPPPGGTGLGAGAPPSGGSGLGFGGGSPPPGGSGLLQTGGSSIGQMPITQPAPTTSSTGRYPYAGTPGDGAGNMRMTDPIGSDPIPGSGIGMPDMKPLPPLPSGSPAPGASMSGLGQGAILPPPPTPGMGSLPPSTFAPPPSSPLPPASSAPTMGAADLGAPPPQVKGMPTYPPLPPGSSTGKLGLP